MSTLERLTETLKYLRDFEREVPKAIASVERRLSKLQDTEMSKGLGQQLRGADVHTGGLIDIDAITRPT
jgi:hypothetical protein